MRTCISAHPACDMYGCLMPHGCALSTERDGMFLQHVDASLCVPSAMSLTPWLVLTHGARQRARLGSRRQCRRNQQLPRSPATCFGAQTPTVTAVYVGRVMDGVHSLVRRPLCRLPRAHRFRRQSLCSGPRRASCRRGSFLPSSPVVRTCSSTRKNSAPLAPRGSQRLPTPASVS